MSESAQRWRTLEDLYQAALDRPPSARAAFLSQACPDESIRREVESLLDARGAGDELLERPAIRYAAQPLQPGAMIGQYRIVQRIGAGGMGEVYQAYDTKLHRQAGLKLLPREQLADPESKQRLLREARAAAALNHPNIVTVYEIGSEGGAEFIAMELVEGKNLQEVIPSPGLPLAATLDYAVQIATGLEKAHTAGIIHRDLKPGNIMVTPDGLVKLLDFGLARRKQVGESETTLTATGQIAGTPAYMSPEQAEGKPVDERSDVFSFGAVLYQMLTGRQAFSGDTAASILAAVLRGEPPPLGTGIPHDVEKLVARCLQKDPARRFQHMEDLRIELEELAAARLRLKHGFLRTVFAAGAVMVLVTAGTLVWQRLHAAPLTDKDMVVLGDFTNATGDSVFDDTLKQGISVQLEQSPFLSLVSDRNVNETLKLMGRSAGDRLTPEVAREVCQRTGSKAMLNGSIAPLGSQYVLGVKAVDCNSGDVLAEAQEQAAAKEAVLKALDAAAVRLRSKLGESIRTVQKYATPLEEATTSSLEALKAYSLGVKTEHAKGDTASLPFFKRAVEVDPNFAAAYGWMAIAYFNLNEIGQATENARKAYALREKVSERERFSIESTYYVWATGELEKGAQTYELWQQSYPRDAQALSNVGFASAALGNWEKALEEWREALRLDPSDGVSYYLLGLAYMSFNRLDEAELAYQQSEDRKLTGEALLEGRYWLAFLKGDAARMAQIVSAAMGTPGSEDLLLALQADTEGWHGKLKNAREQTARAMESARHNNAKETTAGYQAAAALREVESGNRELARADARAAVKLAPNRDVRAIAALALARAGDAAGAENLAAALDKTYPLDTLAQRYWLPTIRAAISLERQDPKSAIELLKVASTIDLSSITSNLSIFLCPVYVRGEAYLMLGDGPRAAAEFQKFIDYRGVVMNFPWGALARLGLARAHALQGDTAKAQVAYQDFLGIWKDADPDLPVLLEARHESEKFKMP